MRQSAYLDVTDYNMGLRDKLKDFFQEGTFRDRLQLAREKVSDIAASSKVQTAAAVITAAGNPIRAAGQIINANVDGPVIGANNIDNEQQQREIQTQIDLNRQMGYASDDAGNKTDRLSRSEREKLAEQYPDAKNELLYEIPNEEKPEPKPIIIETISEQKKQSTLKKEQLHFQDKNPGYRGMPYVEVDGETMFIDEYDYKPPKATEKIKKIVITDPRDTDGPYHGVTITDPEQLKLAEQIKAVSDDVAPEYTNYLLKALWYEGRYDKESKNINIDKETGQATSTDHGPFQINDAYHPDVPLEFAQDPVKATLWAISLIEAGKQSYWVADKHIKAADISIE